LVKRKKNNPNKNNVISIVYKELYNKFKSFNLPSKTAEDCYRNALSVYSGYENDRDVIAIENLNGRGSLSLSTAPHMRYVAPNQLRALS